MSNRISSLLARSAIATHASITGTSFLCSIISTSELSELPDMPDHQCYCHDQHDLQSEKSTTSTIISSPLPWIDELHTIIARMYIGRGTSWVSNYGVMVKIHPDSIFENPIICYHGLHEIERAFRARSALYPWDDRQTSLECIHVEASEDSIISGGGDNKHQNGDPPTVEVVYHLRQKYGSLFYLNSMLKVTVQVQSSERCKTHRSEFFKKREEGAVPIATSGLSKNVLGLNGFLGSRCMSVRDGCRSFFSCRGLGINSQHDDPSMTKSNCRPQELIAEVVKIDECWNGVELIKSKPFHWSRRVNGFLLGSLTFLLFRER